MTRQGYRDKRWRVSARTDCARGQSFYVLSIGALHISLYITCKYSHRCHSQSLYTPYTLPILHTRLILPTGSRRGPPWKWNLRWNSDDIPFFFVRERSRYLPCKRINRLSQLIESFPYVRCHQPLACRYKVRLTGARYSWYHFSVKRNLTIWILGYDERSAANYCSYHNTVHVKPRFTQPPFIRNLIIPHSRSRSLWVIIPIFSSGKTFFNLLVWDCLWAGR